VVFIHKVVIFAKTEASRHGGFLMRHGEYSSATQKFINFRHGEFPIRHGEIATDSTAIYDLFIAMSNLFSIHTVLMVILPCVWIFWLFCRDGTKNFSNRKTKENHCI
jgi:hypothetical protein